ncbi:MAG: ATP-binding protein, partial [Veillonella sp.]|nr:ATP-binding protein [Veillonella sp.]
NVACMYGNKQLLEEVFLNLLDNAIKFSKGDENTITVTAETQPTMTTVVVHDNGIGINNQKIDCIFERFYQADASRGRYEGFGIGLSLVKHIIDLHKGEIRVESEENKSTSFIISIPNKI